jgi:DNA-binding XRE family transcriptional regulator
MNLKEWRIHRAMSQRMLAKASGVTYATICRLERGQHKPNFITINKLSDALVLGDPNEIEWDKSSTSSQPIIYIDQQPSPPPSTPAPVTVSKPVGRPESITDKLAIGKQKLKEDMDKFYKSLLIPILEPRIEKAIAEAIQDGKWHPTYYYVGKCSNVVRSEQAYRKAFAMYGKKRINLYGHTREDMFITLGQEALIHDNLSELQRLGRIDKREQDSPNEAEWRIKDRDWLAALVVNDSITPFSDSSKGVEVNTSPGVR